MMIKVREAWGCTSELEGMHSMHEDAAQRWKACVVYIRMQLRAGRHA